MIQLDTNGVIALLNEQPPAVRTKLDTARFAGAPIVVSAIVYHEPMYGAAYSTRRRNNEEKIAESASAETKQGFVDRDTKDRHCERRETIQKPAAGALMVWTAPYGIYVP